MLTSIQYHCKRCQIGALDVDVMLIVLIVIVIIDSIGNDVQHVELGWLVPGWKARPSSATSFFHPHAVHK